MSRIGVANRSLIRFVILAFALLAALIATSTFTSSTAVFADGPAVVDGFVQDPVTGVVESVYVIEGITYTQDQASGDFAGLLFSHEDDDNFYFGFAQSVFINDNTYFNGAKDDINNPEIGWEKLGRAHRIQDLLQSEHIKVQIFDSPNKLPEDLVLDFFLDYATDDAPGQTVGAIDSLGPTGGDGAVNVGTLDDIPAWSSSLDWNINDADGLLFPDRFSFSPERIATNTYDSGTTANPDSPWIYETVYEWSVAKSGSLAGSTLNDIGISILEVHNSPFKTDNPVPVPVITVSKTSNPPSGDSVDPNETITYTVNVTNTGTSAITNMVITDPIDSNLTNIVPQDGGSFDDTDFDGFTGLITWPTIASFAPGDNVSVHFTADVISTTPEGTSIFNTGTISSPDLATDVDTNTTVHFVTAVPSYSIDKTVTDVGGDGPAGSADQAGDLIAYQIVVNNTGNQSITGASLSDPLLQGANGSLSAPTETGGTGTNGDGVLDVGETWTYTGSYTVQQADIDNNGGGDGDIDNTATVQSNELPNASDSEDVPVLQTPAVEVTKTASVSPVTATISNTASVGTAEGASDSATAINTSLVVAQDITYTIGVANTGNTTLSTVTLTDNVPTGTSFTSASSTQGSCGEAAGVVTCDLGAINVSGNATITLIVRTTLP